MTAAESPALDSELVGQSKGNVVCQEIELGSLKSNSIPTVDAEGGQRISALSQMIAASAVAAIITDPCLPDNPIVDCNGKFCELTGYSREEVVGRNCRFLSGNGTEQQARDTLRAAVTQQTPVVVDILNYRKDGSKFRNSVMIAPIYDDRGRLLAFLGSQSEIPIMDQQVMEHRRETARRKIDALSPRQRDIVIALASGKLIKQIAHDLDLSERTIKMHRAAALKALGVRTTAEAIRFVVEAGY